MSVIMTSEVKRQLLLRNDVVSDDGGGEDTPTITSSGLYCGNTNIYQKQILHHRVVCVKIKLGVEVSC